jgi:hypothetical protein
MFVTTKLLDAKPTSVRMTTGTPAAINVDDYSRSVQKKPSAVGMMSAITSVIADKVEKIAAAAGSVVSERANRNSGRFWCSRSQCRTRSTQDRRDRGQGRTMPVRGVASTVEATVLPGNCTI